MLKIGDIAPDFELQDQSGNNVTLDQAVADGNLILYFYPADFSPVCTAEACAFRDSFAGVSSVGAQVVGVSPHFSSTHLPWFSTPYWLSGLRGNAIRVSGCWFVKCLLEQVCV